MARLIKSEKEVEGRYEEVWTLVEEDAVDPWPAGPRDVVGRDAPRLDGYERARGEARYTGDVRLPGLIDAVLLRSPHARARVARIDLAAAAAAPGVLGVVGPGDVEGVGDGDELRGQRRRRGRRRDARAGAGGRRADRRRVGGARAAARRRGGGRARLAARRDAALRARRPRARPRGGGRRRRGRVPHADAQPQPARDAPVRVRVARRLARRLRLDAVHLGRPQRARAGARPARGPGSRRSASSWAAASARRPASATTSLLAAELARRTGRPVRCALSRREENVVGGNRNATVQRVTAAGRADGTLTALAGEYTCALGAGGWLPPTAGPTQLLYACENVRTVEHGAKLNLPPMAAFRAPGFVEGTWSLECLLDKLAAKLGVDPLELRKLNYAHADAMDGRPFSSKGLMECYRRAEPHWERRHEVRARSDEIWKRGMGMASQIWYGGGGPPSYAWVRLGSDGRANVVTAMQDIGTGTRTAMAMIAAEELGLPLDRVEVQIGDSARGPFASLSGGSSTLPSMGPAVRSAAADAAQQMLELAAQRFDREERTLCARRRQHRLLRRRLVAARGDHRPARRRPDPRQGRARAEPDRHARAHLRHPARRGGSRRRDRRGRRRASRRDPRRRPRDQPARRAQPGRGRDHPGARPHVLGGAARRPGHGHRPDADARRVQAADDRRRARDRVRVRRRARRAPDEPRLEGPRRAADRPDRGRDRERDPRRDRRRRDLAADHARGDPARAPGSRARQREKEKVGAAPA